MTIKPGIGVDDLKFGMTENQIVSIIGKPTKIVIDEDDEYKNPVYQYNELKLRLTFYNEFDKKFGYVRVSNPNIQINNQSIIDTPTQLVIKAYGEKKENWNKESYFTFNSYFNENIWTTINEEYGVITHIEFGYLFDENGENPKWPE